MLHMHSLQASQTSSRVDGRRGSSRQFSDCPSPRLRDRGGESDRGGVGVASASLKIHQRGVQWKQGVVICMLLDTSLLYKTTPIRCTPPHCTPPVMNTRSRAGQQRLGGRRRQLHEGRRRGRAREGRRRRPGGR